MDKSYSQEGGRNRGQETPDPTDGLSNHAWASYVVPDEEYEPGPARWASSLAHHVPDAHRMSARRLEQEVWERVQPHLPPSSRRP